MSNDLNMKVNVLPVLTYNFLHVNDSTLQISDFRLQEVLFHATKVGIFF